MLFGDSFGGQLVPLAASEETRLNSVVLLDGLPSLRQALIEAIPPSLVALYNQSKEAEFNQEVNSIIKDPQLPMDFRVILDYTLWGFNTTNAYDAWTGEHAVLESVPAVSVILLICTSRSRQYGMECDYGLQN